MMVALENFIQLEKERKCIIIGDMYELGEESPSEHKGIVDFLDKYSDFDCHFIGKDFSANAIYKEKFHFYQNFDEFTTYLSFERLHNRTLLIKGSRGMALERTLEYL